MIKTGKCPGCKKVVMKAQFEAIELMEGFQSEYKGVSFICPSCKCVLGVGIDPIALKADIVNEVVARLRKGS